MMFQIRPHAYHIYGSFLSEIKDLVLNLPEFGKAGQSSPLFPFDNYIFVKAGYNSSGYQMMQIILRMDFFV